MAELLPCPFCKGEAFTYGLETWWVSHACYVLGKYIGTKEYDTEAEAIAAWNTRAVRTCKNNDTDNDDFFQCSECGSSSVTEFLRGGYGLPNYCPHCGAKVIGENE